MKIFMTGSRGFIASHLKRELRERGHEVVGVDKVAPWGMSHVEFGEIVDDVSRHEAFSDLLRGVVPDRVFHLAAQVGREFGEDDVLRTVRDNATATTLVAHACGRVGIPVTYTSTSEVYGDNGRQAVYEKVGPFNLPHNLYGLTKRWGEEALQLYAPDGLQIARLSMPYGPGAPPGRGRRAMDNFLWQAHHGMPIPVHRGSRRSWCHVSDTVRALRMMAEDGRTGVWNVGRDDDDRPLRDVAEMACRIAGADESLIQDVDPPSMQTVVKRLSTQALRRDFGWSPEVGLEEGMEHLYEWIRRFDAEGRMVG